VLGIDLDRIGSIRLLRRFPNDEPMFGFFPLSVGVANVRRFLDRMKSHPAYVTRTRGDRIREGAGIILRKRGAGT